MTIRATAAGKTAAETRECGRSTSTERVGNAHQKYERYVALAREATLNGDTIEAENCYQHAEHYFRAMRERIA